MNARCFIYKFSIFSLLIGLLVGSHKDAFAIIVNYPSDVLDLKPWKLTLPINNAQEIKQPELSMYSSPYFYLNRDKSGVTFYSPAGGATTPNSSYARSELREMKSNSYSVTSDCSNPDNKACWSSSIGYHSLTIDQSVNHLPMIKPHVVIGQIHDNTDDVVVIRLEGKKLFINADGTADDVVLSTNYQLGTRFTVKFEVENDQTKYYYNGEPVKNSQGQPVVLSRNYKNAYFKAGMYVQSVEGNSEYGESEIYNLTSCHASSQAQAAIECTPHSTITPIQNCLADVNQSGIIDLVDYSILVREFLKTHIQLNADINKDGIVDLKDYSILVKNFLRSC